MMAGGMMPVPPPLIKPLLQGTETWRGLHNALQCARMGQSQWTAGTEKRKRRETFEAFEIKSLSSSTRLIFPKVKY